MKTRIAIYGGTNLSPALVLFVRRLTRDLLRFPDIVLLSGGFKYFKRYPDRISVDLAVLDEAEASIDPTQFAERFETWVPALDRNPVERFEKGTVHHISGTAQARRFTLVNAADALITIAGEGNTRMVLEMALAISKPVLPVAFSGSDSLRIWKRHRNDLIAPLRLPPQLINRLERGSSSALQLSRLASQVATVVHDAAQKRCLVLMPFGRGHDGYYTNVIHPAVEAAGYMPHRIDRDEYSGNIPSLFLSSLARARAVVVDVTGDNPNVMYELGQAHARGINPLIVTRRRAHRTANFEMPFYLQHERVFAVLDNDAGHRLIARELRRYLDRLVKSPGEGRRRS